MSTNLDGHRSNDDLTQRDFSREDLSDKSGSGSDGQSGAWSFSFGKLVIGVAICYYFFNTHLIMLLYLAVVVAIHEFGHVIAGKVFGCEIREMQVFLLSFVSYKPQYHGERHSWRDITWSVGTLPLGGFTVFKTRSADAPETDITPAAASPFIDDKPAWQRMIISSAGILMNLTTFLVLYLSMPYLSFNLVAMGMPLMSLSLVLSVLNILPVYPLDGGSIIFACYEMISGKKPSDSFVRLCGLFGFGVIVLIFWVFPQWVNGLLDKVFGLFF